MISNDASPSADIHAVGRSLSPSLDVPVPLLLFLINQVRKAEDYRRRAWAEHDYWARGDIAPAPKIVGLLTARRLGFGPGDPNPNRPHEWQTVFRDEISRQSGLHPDKVGAYWRAMAIAGWFRCRCVWTTDPRSKKPRMSLQFAPPEGPAWERTWGNPALMPCPPPSPHHKKDTLAKGTRKSKQPALRCCPICGSVDGEMVCKTCGTIVQFSEM